MPTQDGPDDLHPEVTLPPASRDPDEAVSTASPAAGPVSTAAPDASDRSGAARPGDVAGETAAPEAADGPVGTVEPFADTDDGDPAAPEVEPILPEAVR